MSKEIFVHVDVKGSPLFAGRLWIHSGRGGESASFEYSKEWLAFPGRFSLEPYLDLGGGSFQSPKGKSLFGSMGDSAPDRWGRVLMERREAVRARREGRAPRRLLDSDYLLMVSDYARQGALRFSESQHGPFLTEDAVAPIPPIISLGRLYDAAKRIIERKDVDQDIKDLVDPGSSLGGARPKASVIGPGNSLLIAKFSSPKDKWNVVAWEHLCLRLAAKAQIQTPQNWIEKIGDVDVLLVSRFDRDVSGNRIPYLSAMSMLNYSDGAHGSYLEIADVIKERGATANQDLISLWRRMVFNILTSNVDDHLRNHGFLYTGINGWVLSPVFDLESTPITEKDRVLHTRIDLYDGTASLDLAMSVAEEFGLSQKTAKSIAKEVGDSVSQWELLASSLGIPRSDVDVMRSAFDHEELRQSTHPRVVSTQVGPR